MASFCFYFVLGAFQLLTSEIVPSWTTNSNATGSITISQSCSVILSCNNISTNASGNPSSSETSPCSTVCPTSSVTISGALTSSVILSTTQTIEGKSSEITTSFPSVAPSVTPIPTSTLSSSLLTNSSTSLLNNATTTATASSNSTAKLPTPSPTANTTTSTQIAVSNATSSDNSTTTSASSSMVIGPSTSGAPGVTSTESADIIASTSATISSDPTSSLFSGSQSKIVVTPSPTVTGAGASSYSSQQFALSPTSSPDSSSVTSNTSGQHTTEVSPTNATAFIPSTSAILPITPPKTKSISMKVTLVMEFKESYKDTNSDAYEELKKNLTNELEKVFQNTEGFVRIEIFSFRKGSVICDFDVVLNESASVNGEDLKKTLQEASKNGLGGFKVTNIEVKDEKKDEKTKEVLPLWAMVTLILLGALGLVLLITIIILAVLYKRAKESGPRYEVSGDEWAHYESMSMGDYKVRAEEVDRRRLRNGDNNQPVYANHPVSHSNLTYEVPANGE